MMRPLFPQLVRTVRTAALAGVPLLVVASCAEPPAKKIDGECVPTTQYFNDNVWNAFMSNKCSSCHSAQGIAAETEFVLQSASQPGFLEANLATVSHIAEFERDGTSIILLKPSNQIDHNGGKVIEVNGEEYKALAELVRQLKNPVVCEDTGNDRFAGVQLLDNRATLRKATLTLAGRLPTEAEFAQVDGGDAEDLDAAIDNLLLEDPVYVRLKEMYNDIFLTDKYINGQRGTELLDGDRFPNAFWYNDEFPDERTEEQERERRRLEQATNLGVAREALELVAYLAKNDLPFTDIVAADYIMVNPYSARAYGVADDVTFLDDTDATEFQPAIIPEYAHSGVLSSAMWLNRFPTTDTNRNRHRARMVYKFFLATDILRIADRPVDSASVAGFNPTLNDPSCTVCHAAIDPVAGAFQNWSANGAFEPPVEGWFGDMFPPGYGEQALPFDERFVATNWLGDRIAEDPLFALSTVHTIYKGLTGRDPVVAPADSTDPAFTAKNEAFVAQDAEFKKIAEEFTSSGFKLKTVIKGVIQSPYFRAKGVQSNAISPEHAPFHESLGTAQFLTPELLDKKIEAVLGYPWTRGFDTRRLLLDLNEYQIYYGGIDSDGVTSRITAPNGLMSSVATRMAFEMACRTGARDFVLPAETRLLFPLVEPTYEPEDENGFNIPAGEAAIKANIVHLFKRILDEDLSAEDEEVIAAYDLWVGTWRAGKANVVAQTENRDVPGACQVNNDYFTNEQLPEEQRFRSDPNYTVRAWNAVLAYLLSDARFLHN